MLHLHDLVSMAFKAATSETDSLRPVGVWALKDIVEVSKGEKILCCINITHVGVFQRSRSRV